MKPLLSFMICAMLTITCSWGQAHNSASEKQVEKTLLEFYTKHFYIWKNTTVSKSVPANVRREKLDSLMQKYCTSKIRRKAIEAYDSVGADWFTNDLIDDLNENLKVAKDSNKENMYVVSFTAINSDHSGELSKKNVRLYITVVKIGEHYKIDSVK